jgi:hypothetical protein
MADNRTPHFVVSSEAIRTTPIDVRGRSAPVMRPSYSAHGDYLRERAAAVREHSAASADGSVADSLFLQVKTPVNFPIEKERVRIAQAGLQIISLSSNDALVGTARIRRADFPTLQRRLNIYADSPRNRGRSYFSVIEDFAPVPAIEKIAPELAGIGPDPVDCLLFFYSTLAEFEKAPLLLAMRSFLGRINARLGSTRRLRSGAVAVGATLTSEQAQQVSEAFTTIRYIRPDTLFYAPDAFSVRPVPKNIGVSTPDGKTAVMLFDTGVDPTTPGLGGCIQRVIDCLPPGAVAPRPSHGTFVASRIAFGDDIEAQIDSDALKPRTPLIDVPIFGVDQNGSELNPSVGHVANAIETAIAQRPPNARVMNLSLGTNQPVNDNEVSLIAFTLDNCAQSHDILAVTSAGNMRDGRLLSAFPSSLTDSRYRIDSPAESLSAVAVGSIALREDKGSMSSARSLSAFSRRGPGLMSGIKPDLVAHGGNCGRDGKPTDATGVYGLLNANKGLAVDIGTSFAAPLVASMAARLMDHYPSQPAVMIKALLLHFTKPALSPNVSLPQEFLIGRGEPDLESAMWSSAHSATFMATGSLRSSHHAFIPFYVPACLTATAGSKLRVRATVVINPAVNFDSPLEYSCCRLTLGLRKPSRTGYLDVSGKNEFQSLGAWSPVESASWEFSRSIQPGQWNLKVRLWTRNLPTDYLQPYAAVIQIWDEKGIAPVSQDVRNSAERYIGVAQVPVAA